MNDLISRSALEMCLQETNIRIAADKGKMFDLIQSAPAVDAISRSEVIAQLEGFKISIGDVIMGFVVDRIIERVKNMPAVEWRTENGKN